MKNEISTSEFVKFLHCVVIRLWVQTYALQKSISCLIQIQTRPGLSGVSGLLPGTHQCIVLVVDGRLQQQPMNIKNLIERQQHVSRVVFRN